MTFKHIRLLFWSLVFCCVFFQFREIMNLSWRLQTPLMLLCLIAFVQLLRTLASFREEESFDNVQQYEGCDCDCEVCDYQRTKAEEN